MDTSYTFVGPSAATLAFDPAMVAGLGYLEGHVDIPEYVEKTDTVVVCKRDGEEYVAFAEKHGAGSVILTLPGEPRYKGPARAIYLNKSMTIRELAQQISKG